MCTFNQDWAVLKNLTHTLRWCRKRAYCVYTTELKMTEWKTMVHIASSSQSSNAAQKNVLADGRLTSSPPHSPPIPKHIGAVCGWARGCGGISNFFYNTVFYNTFLYDFFYKTFFYTAFFYNGLFYKDFFIIIFLNGNFFIT